MTKTISTREAGELVGLTARRIQQHITSGALPAERIGRDWRIDPRDLDKIPDRKRPGRKRKVAKE